MTEIAREKRSLKNEDSSHNFRSFTEENENTIHIQNQSELERFKYIKINATSYCITQLFEDLEWLVKTVNFTKAFSDYLVYCTNQGFSESSGRSKSAIFGRDEVSYENIKRPLDLETQGFSESRGRSKSAIFGRDEVSYENPIETDSLILLEKTPFLKYKEYVKEKYRHLVYVLKQVYKNALVLPDAEKVSLTISNDFNMENDLFLKNPEFIIDHFIFHIYCHNHISDNYEKVITVLKVFEYLYHKTLNYVNELEFDISNKDIQ